MPRFVRSDSSPPPGHLARHAARLDRCWPLVHVESVQIAPGAAGDCVSAVVQLGGLTPADVRVELMPTGAAAGTSGVADDERRMFSCQDLANGSFVFTATLPHGDPTAPHEWLIHVHPSEALEEPRVEYGFSR